MNEVPIREGDIITGKYEYRMGSVYNIKSGEVFVNSFGSLSVRHESETVRICSIDGGYDMVLETVPIKMVDNIRVIKWHRT